jgi:N-acyl-D-amino-acid deacylase
MYDVIIKDGMVVDGTGSPWYRADVGIKAGKIVRISHDLSGEGTKKLISAEGLTVAPGFIDMHSHSDIMLFSSPTADEKVRQGVTSELLGQDGIGVAPISDKNLNNWRKVLSGLAGDPDIEWSWRDFASYLDALDKAKTSTNPVVLATHGAIRQEVIGLENRRAEPAELDRMKELTAECMAAGAVGLSLGLIYLPCFYANRKELVEVYKTCSQYNGFMVVHIRNEAELAEEAMQEVIDITKEAKVPLHISHFKTAGRNNWHKTDEMIAMAEQARREGLEVTFDQYPYIAGSTMFFAVLPQWALEGGATSMLQRLQDKDLREKIRHDIAHGIPGWQNMARDTGWEGVMVTAVKTEKNKELEGMYMSEIAERLGKDPVDAAMDLLLEEDAAVGMATFAQSEENVKKILKHDYQMPCTDGLLGGKPHPRVYGTFPRILGKYVREEKVISLPTAIRKMTSFPAQRLGLKDRGLIREGMAADITVFNAETIIDKATYAEPRQYPEGIEYVLVNGDPVVFAGQHTGSRPGYVLRRK